MHVPAAPLIASVVSGYLLGSFPVAVLLGRLWGFDPRAVGDRNPGFTNMKNQLGWSGAAPVLFGDVLKGTLAGLAGHGLVGVWVAYAAVGAAMIGHAWPVFAGFRGGRSVATFVGGFAVVAPWAALVGLGVFAALGLAARSFSRGGLAGVFSAPLAQLLFDPVGEVAATGGLMCLLGLRFLQASLPSLRSRWSRWRA